MTRQTLLLPIFGSAGGFPAVTGTSRVTLSNSLGGFDVRSGNPGHIGVCGFQLTQNYSLVQTVRRRTQLQTRKRLHFVRTPWVNPNAYPGVWCRTQRRPPRSTGTDYKGGGGLL
jgi:hypothetical protein